MSNLVVRALLGACLGLLFPTWVIAQTAPVWPIKVRPVSYHRLALKDPVKYVFGCQSSPCVVRSNPGGIAGYYFLAGIALSNGSHGKMIIDGPCKSGCTIAAAWALPNACVTDRATLHFHKGWRLVQKGKRVWREFIDVSFFYPFDIQEWIEAQGGLPEQGFIAMSAGVAREFWPPCPFKPPLPRPDPRTRSIEVAQTLDQWILDTRPIATRPPPKEDGVLSAKPK